jgi:hypothetical protein
MGIKFSMEEAISLQMAVVEYIITLKAAKVEQALTLEIERQQALKNRLAGFVATIRR